MPAAHDRFNQVEDPRRRLLIDALALGLLSVALPAPALSQNVFGSSPAKLPPGQSIYRIAGTVMVNATPATLATPVRPGDTIETGENSEVIFVVGSHSMLLRSGSRLVVEADAKAPTSIVLTGLRLLTGKLLSASRDTQMRVVTQTATIGIRGTGWYAESEPDQTYFCTCYGMADIAATDDPSSSQFVASKQHDRPLYILREGAEGQRIRSAPYINHTDDEAALIEALVGRTLPFEYKPKGEYLKPEPPPQPPPPPPSPTY